jgi:hypothetical protein
VGTLRVFSRLDHYIWYRSWRYLKRKFKKVSTSKLVERFYQGIDTPTGRTWQFHGTWVEATSDIRIRRGSVSWLILLCKTNKPMPAHMFKALNEVLKVSFYKTSEPHRKWAVGIFSRRNIRETSNNWSELYKKQKGVCYVCKQSLGYLLEENLEIHHLKQVILAPLEVNKIDNLRLLHKSCHRTIKVVFKC